MTEATKLIKGSIYGNFQNKEEIALAVFDYNHSLRTKIILEKIDAAKTSKEKLMAFPTVYCGDKIRNLLNSSGCFLLNMGLDVDDTDEPFRKKIAEAVLNWKKNLQNIIQQGIDNQEFRSNIEPEQVALTMIALIQGAVF